MVDNILGGIGGGLGWGLGLGIALGATSLVGGGLRPVAKGAIKGGLWAKEQLAGAAAEMGERAQDLYHEARAERSSGNGHLVVETTPVVEVRGRRRSTPEVVPTPDDPS